MGLSHFEGRGSEGGSRALVYDGTLQLDEDRPKTGAGLDQGDVLWR